MTRSPCEHDRLACPRCGIRYECNVGSISLCSCTAIQLTEDQRQYIGSLFSGCLCTSCLLVLREEYSNQLISFSKVLSPPV